MIDQAVKQYFAALDSLDPERYVACFSEDAIVHDPVGTPPHRGHAGLRAFLTGIAGLVREVRFTIEYVNVAGNEAAIKWRATSTGMNGKTVDFEGIDTMEFDASGKIRVAKGFWNAGPALSAWMS